MDSNTQLSAIIGVDGGGTSTKAIAVDFLGNPLSMGKAGPSNPNNTDFLSAATEILKAIDIAAENHPIAAACLGIAGIASNVERESLRNALISLRPELTGARLKITHDLEIAQYAAFSGKAGAVIIAGTGSACYAKSKTGEELRASGRAYEYEDPGSGYAIGRRGIERGLFPDRNRRSEVAALATEVVRMAEAGNKSALEILKTEAANLAKLVKPIAKDIPTILVGGMLDTESLYLNLVREKLDFATIVESTDCLPEVGALQMAWEQASDAPFHLLNVRP